MSARAHSLKNQLDSNEVILGDYHDLPQFMLSSGNLTKLPDPQSASYAHLMLTFCLDNYINMVYVLDSKEADQLAETKQLFAEYEIQIITNEI